MGVHSQGVNQFIIRSLGRELALGGRKQTQRQVGGLSRLRDTAELHGEEGARGVLGEGCGE